MPVDTHVHDAESRVQSERNAVEERVDAIDRFVDRVGDCPPAPAPPSAGGVTATVGAVRPDGRSTKDRCQVVRRAFAETIRPHSLDDEGSESLHETIQHELSGSIAVALAPASETTFSPALKQAVLSEAGARRAEAETLCRALDREASQLEDAREVVEETVDWIATADETPLTELGFEDLRARHERLAAYRTRCEDLAEERQAFVDATTSDGPEVGICHRSLLPYLYEDFPVDYPVLATAALLEDTCRECQRAVRKHLTRRT